MYQLQLLSPSLIIIGSAWIIEVLAVIVYIVAAIYDAMTGGYEGRFYEISGRILGWTTIYAVGISTLIGLIMLFNYLFTVVPQ